MVADMGAACFSFDVDPSRDLVRIAMAGLFAERDVAEFAEARRQAHALLRCEPNRHVTLNDLRDMKIQPQATVDAFHIMLAAPEYRSQRLAFVIPGTLATRQLLRALSGRGRCFTDPAIAEAWLLSANNDEVEEGPGRLAG